MAMRVVRVVNEMREGVREVMRVVKLAKERRKSLRVSGW